MAQHNFYSSLDQNICMSVVGKSTKENFYKAEAKQQKR